MCAGFFPLSFRDGTEHGSVTPQDENFNGAAPRRMRGKTRIIGSAVIIFTLAFGAYLLFSPLAVFTRTVSHADRAVVNLLPHSIDPPVSITITGENLRLVTRMLSSGHRDRSHYDCSPLTNVKFF